MTIIPASCQDHYIQVYQMTHNAFVEEGYIRPHPSGLYKHYARWEHIPETKVLVAIEDGEVIGTLSTTIDGQKGLNVDVDYHPVVEKIRSERKKLAASWRMVTLKKYRNNRKLAFDLFQATFNLYLHHHVETVLYTFNPRHEKIYKALFNLQTLAYQLDSVTGLQNAPSVLMRMDISSCPPRWFNGVMESSNNLNLIET